MITVCCPTRGRPFQMRRLYESIIKTALDPGQVEVVFYIDDDDDGSIEEYTNLNINMNDTIQAVIGPRICLSQTWNECYKAGQGLIYMVCADDIVFESKNWDKLVIEKFDKCEDKILLVYGKDGGKNERLSTHPFIHKNWIETVGFFTPPYFEFCMCDTWLFTIASRLNRTVFIPEIYTAHWNCTNKSYTSGVPDKTWTDMQARGATQDYRGIFHKKGAEREEIYRKLQAFIDDFRSKNSID